MVTKSILPNSCNRILEPMVGVHGTMQVKWIEAADMHGLFFGESILAMHHNGYSCHALAERILKVWVGENSTDYAMKQFDHILRCGGVGKSRESIVWIAEGCQE